MENNVLKITLGNVKHANDPGDFAIIDLRDQEFDVYYVDIYEHKWAGAYHHSIGMSFNLIDLQNELKRRGCTL